jgi:hypothetical protein
MRKSIVCKLMRRGIIGKEVFANQQFNFYIVPEQIL